MGSRAFASPSRTSSEPWSRFTPSRAGDGGTLPLSWLTSCADALPSASGDAGRVQDAGLTRRARLEVRSRNDAEPCIDASGDVAGVPSRDDRVDSTRGGDAFFLSATEGPARRAFFPCAFFPERRARCSARVSVAAMLAKEHCPGVTTLCHSMVLSQRSRSPSSRSHRSGMPAHSLGASRNARSVSRSAASCVAHMACFAPSICATKAQDMPSSAILWPASPVMFGRSPFLMSESDERWITFSDTEFRRPKNWSAEPFTQSVGTSRRHREPNRPRGGGAGEEDVDREGPRTTSDGFSGATAALMSAALVSSCANSPWLFLIVLYVK
mmetsp:Transcript_11164/g.47638  ORF Transcript_11164/g.47638 Transcript_11164/m.47638 type:complete len:326 (-) Transcript_11164:1282-2259(-)